MPTQGCFSRISILHHHRVHDREVAAVLIILDLGFLRVGKKQRNFRIAGAHRRQGFGIERRFELAVDKHLVDVFALGHALDVHPGGRFERDVLFLLAPPLDGLQIDVVMILQDTAHPQAGGILQGIERILLPFRSDGFSMPQPVRLTMY